MKNLNLLLRFHISGIILRLLSCSKIDNYKERQKDSCKAEKEESSKILLAKKKKKAVLFEYFVFIFCVWLPSLMLGNCCCWRNQILNLILCGEGGASFGIIEITYDYKIVLSPHTQKPSCFDWLGSSQCDFLKNKKKKKLNK